METRKSCTEDAVKRREREITARKLFSLALRDYRWEKLSLRKLLAVVRLLDLIDSI